MKSKYSTIFFDWSGVIADDTGDYFIAQSIKKFGATDSQIVEIVKNHFRDFMLGNLSEIEYWNRIKNDYKLNIPEQYCRAFNNWSGIMPNEKILNFASDLKNRGYKIGIITNIIQPVYDIIKKSGYYNIFDSTIASCEVNIIKPQKEIYELSLNRLNTSAVESIFIDDKQSNLDAAIQIGFTTILATNTKQIINDTSLLIPQ